MQRNKRSISSLNIDAAITAVKEIYQELAERPIERDCRLNTACCHFLVTGKTPFLTKGEALVAAKALRATGRRVLPARSDGACRLLDEKTARCTIYHDRPFACRTHFCEAAGGPYTRREVVDLIHRLEEIDRQLYGSGARQIHAAIEETYL